MKIILQTNLNSPLRLYANFLRWGLWDKPRVRKKIDGTHMKRTYQEHQLGCCCEGHRHRQTRLKGISRQSWSEETFDCVSLFFKQKSVRKSIFIPYWCTSIDLFFIYFFSLSNAWMDMMHCCWGALVSLKPDLAPYAPEAIGGWAKQSSFSQIIIFFPVIYLDQSFCPE